MTEELTKKLNSDFEAERGIYNSLFNGYVEICVSTKSNQLDLKGEIISDSKTVCNTLYKTLKAEVKRIFTNCNKIEDIIVMKGNKLF